MPRQAGSKHGTAVSRARRRPGSVGLSFQQESMRSLLRQVRTRLPGAG